MLTVAVAVETKESPPSQALAMQSENIILWLLGSSGAVIGLILAAWYSLNGNIARVSERVSKLQGVQEGRQQAENTRMLEELMKSMIRSGSGQDG